MSRWLFYKVKPQHLLKFTDAAAFSLIMKNNDCKHAYDH